MIPDWTFLSVNFNGDTVSLYLVLFTRTELTEPIRIPMFSGDGWLEYVDPLIMEKYVNIYSSRQTSLYLTQGNE